MKNLSELVGETLIMVQPSMWKTYFELKHNGEVIGTIRSSKFFGLNMIFKMDNKEWEIYHPSFWKFEIAIREQGYEMPIAKYSRDGFKNRGTIYLPTRFASAKAGREGDQLKIIFKLFIGCYSIETLSGQCLVSFKEKFSLRIKTKIIIEQRSELLDKYPWIIAVAWYISLKGENTQLLLPQGNKNIF